MHRSNRFAALAATCIVLGSGGTAVAAAPPPEIFPESPVTSLLAAEAGVRSATVQRLSVAATPGEPVRFAAVLDGETVEFDLHHHSSRAEDCRLLVERADGTVEELDLPPARTWRGLVAGDPSRSVAATIDAEGRVTATIVDEIDGRSWGIQPAAGAGGLDEVFKEWSVVYARADIVPHEGTCGVDLDDPDISGGRVVPRSLDAVAGEEGGSPVELGGPERLDIAFDADFEYYVARGSSVAAVLEDIETVMNVVGLNYQNQVGISYRYTGFLVRTGSNDPYTSGNPGTRLCQFRDNWNAVNWFPRDTAHLFTGLNLDGTTIGIAYVGALCNPTSSGCNGGSFSYGLSESTFSTNQTSRAILTMHELGHNWNACHCNQSACTGGGSDADCGVMESNINNGSLSFGNRSLNTILAYRAGLSCLAPSYNPTYVNVAWSGFEFGTITFPFNTFSEGVWAVPVGGVVSFQGGTYPQNLHLVKPMVLQRTGSSTVVLGQ